MRATSRRETDIAKKSRKTGKKSLVRRPQPLQLYYWPTPNGHKIAILLEELRLPYALHPININKGEQFAPAFLKISPNNRIPAIVDPDGPGGRPVSVFESGAILQYLGRKTGKFYPAADRARIAVEEWLFWQVGGLGPMAGQANHFLNYSAEDLPYPKKRYTDEVHRLLGVMNTRLAKTNYLAGAYSIADIASYSWVRSATRYTSLEEFPNLAGWFERVGKRSAVKRGLEVGKELRKPMTDADKKVLFGQRAR
ncbi:MAG TPA: glutathione S-transferase N-terminal domain-containing protein [Rhizomicrobium sp.]|nr:glutathione S-transferase N-terminal domain-containing protein [Rhizomicrobium sp.]